MKLKNNWKISIAATVIQRLLTQTQMTREQIIFFISKSNQESINPPQDKLTNVINVINNLTARHYTTKEISRMGAQNAIALTYWIDNPPYDLSKKELTKIAVIPGSYLCLDYIKTHWNTLVNDTRLTGRRTDRDFGININVAIRG